MGSRFFGRLGIIAASVLIASGLAPATLAATVAPAAPAALTAPAAPAAPAAGAKREYCSPGDPNAVTVVVDYHGSIDIRCSSGATGKAALSNAGFPITEVGAQPGFVCQIDGRPASDCADTPPTTAYWSYWQAAPGGGWTYSSRGYGSSRVKAGGFEGWSFGAGGAPGVDPVLPAAPEPEPKPPAPDPVQPPVVEPAPPPAGEAAPAADNGGSGGSRGGGADSGGPDNGGVADDAGNPAAPIGAGPNTDSSDPAAESAAGSAAVADPVTSAGATTLASSASAGVGSDPAGGPGTAGSPVSSGGATPLAAEKNTSSGSTVWLSVAALGALAALGAAAAVIARRRRGAG